MASHFTVDYRDGFRLRPITVADLEAAALVPNLVGAAELAGNRIARRELGRGARVVSSPMFRRYTQGGRKAIVQVWIGKLVPGGGWRCRTIRLYVTHHYTAPAGRRQPRGDRT